MLRFGSGDKFCLRNDNFRSLNHRRACGSVHTKIVYHLPRRRFTIALSSLSRMKFSHRRFQFALSWVRDNAARKPSKPSFPPSPCGSVRRLPVFRWRHRRVESKPMAVKKNRVCCILLISVKFPPQNVNIFTPSGHLLSIVYSDVYTVEITTA